MKKDDIINAIDSLDEDMLRDVARLRNSPNKQRNKRIIRYTALAACFCLVFSFVVFKLLPDTEYTVKAENLMEGIVPNSVAITSLDKGNEAYNDFAVRLFKATEQSGENTLISPLSVFCALSMTANGANGETLSQIESVLGMSINELNEYLYSYINTRPQGDKYSFDIANAIWFRDTPSFEPNLDFLQTNADYYSAEIRKDDFDNGTLRDINNWIEQKTDGMIPKMLDEIDQNAIMYLINALVFEAEWEETYAEHTIRNREFKLENGEQVKVEYMGSTESIYLSSDDATGFIKPYKDGKYAFAAILPNEDISITDYVQSLSGEKLNELFMSQSQTTVYASMPSFETGFKTKLNDALIEMGMPLAFDLFSADFSKMGKPGGLYISNVYHETSIAVTYTGTKAGAATVVEMNCGGIPDYVEVCLTRPYVYMIIDSETYTPLFIGTMMNPNA